LVIGALTNPHGAATSPRGGRGHSNRPARPPPLVISDAYLGGESPQTVHQKPPGAARRVLVEHSGAGLGLPRCSPSARQRLDHAILVQPLSRRIGAAGRFTDPAPVGPTSGAPSSPGRWSSRPIDVDSPVDGVWTSTSGYGRGASASPPGRAAVGAERRAAGWV